MTTDGGDEGADASGPFDIYETAGGPRHVGNPVRRLILSKMQGCELTVPEMIRATGLTKSTISTHLSVLYKDQMVAYREDPKDRRRKFYYLTARHVGTTRRCTERLPFHDAEEEAAPAGPAEVSRLLLRALVAELTCCGLDLAPVVRETGRRVGELAARHRDAEGLDGWFREARGFWREAGLGDLHRVDGDRPVVQVDACGLCFRGADRRMSLCAIAAGILEGMASEMLRTCVRAEQVEGQRGDASEGGCGCTFRLHIDGPETTVAATAPGRAVRS